MLEHPAYSDAFAHFGLPIPSCDGAWTSNLFDGGWSCYVEQSRYGHVAKKATWLYAFGVKSLPSLKWGHVADQHVLALVSWCGNQTKSGDKRPRIGKKRASRSPLAFRDTLIAIAASVRRPQDDVIERR